MCNILFISGPNSLTIFIQCGPLLPNGGVWDGSSPWYCQSLKIALGGVCWSSAGVVVRNGCTSGTQVKQKISKSLEAGDLKLPELCTNTVCNILLLLTIFTQCGPWLPNGGSWDGSSSWYCLSLPKLSAGASCDYNNFVRIKQNKCQFSQAAYFHTPI